jgi:hypothetical protein
MTRLVGCGVHPPNVGNVLVEGSPTRWRAAAALAGILQFVHIWQVRVGGDEVGTNRGCNSVMNVRANGSE